MQIGGGEETEKESSGGFQFEAVDFDPCFIKNIDIKVIACEVVHATVVLIARTRLSQEACCSAFAAPALEWRV